MKITRFHIQNYKGINDTYIPLTSRRGCIYTLVGLNESGKTTILEAINSFRHDVDGIHAIVQKTIPTDPIAALVPKKKKDNFNDDISVAATVHLDRWEIQQLAQRCRRNHGFQIDISRFPLEFQVERAHTLRVQNTRTLQPIGTFILS